MGKLCNFFGTVVVAIKLRGKKITMFFVSFLDCGDKSARGLLTLKGDSTYVAFKLINVINSF